MRKNIRFEKIFGELSNDERYVRTLREITVDLASTPLDGGITLFNSEPDLESGRHPERYDVLFGFQEDFRGKEKIYRRVADNSGKRIITLGFLRRRIDRALKQDKPCLEIRYRFTNGRESHFEGDFGRISKIEIGGEKSPLNGEVVIFDDGNVFIEISADLNDPVAVGDSNIVGRRLRRKDYLPLS